MDRVFAEYYLQAGFTTCPVTGEQIKESRLVPVRTPLPPQPPQPPAALAAAPVHWLAERLSGRLCCFCPPRLQSLELQRNWKIINVFLGLSVALLGAGRCPTWRST